MYKVSHGFILIIFDATYYRTINIIWEQHHVSGPRTSRKMLGQILKVSLNSCSSSTQCRAWFFNKGHPTSLVFSQHKHQDWSPIAPKRQILTVRIHFNTSNAQTLNLLHSLRVDTFADPPKGQGGMNGRRSIIKGDMTKNKGRQRIGR